MTTVRDVIAEILCELDSLGPADDIDREIADNLIEKLCAAPEAVRLELAAKLNPWRPEWRHRKRGTAYKVIGAALTQTDLMMGDSVPVIIYRGENGAMWVRPAAEFHDGRFEALPAPPSEDK